MKKLFLSLAVLFSLTLGFFIDTKNVFADNEVTAYFFYGNGCPHCAKEAEFFASIVDQYPTLRIEAYEVYFDRANSRLMQEASNVLNANASGVPFLIIGDEYFVGFSETYSPDEIKSRINYCITNECPDSVFPLTKEDNSNLEHSTETEKPQEEIEKKEKIIKLPFIGNTDVHNLSLPVLAVFMGLLDGFNPCAMWALLFLISLLLGMKNKKRMWILGTTFIVASAVVYFIFMAAWLNLMLFLGLIIWIRLVIGALALFGGGYSVRKFFTGPKNGCEISGGEKKQKMLEKLKDFTKRKNLWVALGGIILLAFMVNLVELVCSAGLPAIFTQVLSMNNLSTASYYLHILLYILFFMIDDLFVFFVAMVTLRMTGITTKYSRYSHLIGGVLMLIIGAILIIKPELLMFG